MYSKYKDKDIFDLKNQFEIISSLPNFHHWNILKSHGVKMDEYFINNGNSPRNRLMRNFLIVCEVDYYEVIKRERLDIIKAIISKGFTQDNIKKPNKQLSKKKKISKQYKLKLSVTHLLHQVGINKEEFDDMKMEIKIKGSSISNTFKKNWLIHGSFHWRVKSNKTHRVVMNDFDPESASFKV